MLPICPAPSPWSDIQVPCLSQTHSPSLKLVSVPTLTEGQCLGSPLGHKGLCDLAPPIWPSACTCVSTSVGTTSSDTIFWTLTLTLPPGSSPGAQLSLVLRELTLCHPVLISSGKSLDARVSHPVLWTRISAQSREHDDYFHQSAERLVRSCLPPSPAGRDLTWVCFLL